MITSTTNDSVKYVLSLYRRRTRYQEKAFVIEGVRAVEEAMKAGLQPAFVFHTSAVLDAPRARETLTMAEGRHASLRTVSEPVMAAMADTVTPSGILAVVPMLDCPIPRPLTWALVIDGLRDPGNMGTILRSALAAGVDLVMATPGTVDVYSPKVVRAAMGAHFRLRIRVSQSWRAIEDALQGLSLLLADPRDGLPYWEVDWRRPTALVIGNEAQGPSGKAEQLAPARVTIPMRDYVESINAAVATSILLFEAARQRSTARQGP